MKILLLFICLAPTMVFANDYAPFKNVEKLDDQILLTFNDNGIKFSVTYKDKNFITSSGQILHINKGDKLVLIEKHTKYIVTATTSFNLHVQYIHNWQGNETKKTYDIAIIINIDTQSLKTHSAIIQSSKNEKVVLID